MALSTKIHVDKIDSNVDGTKKRRQTDRTTVLLLVLFFRQLHYVLLKWSSTLKIDLCDNNDAKNRCGTLVIKLWSFHHISFQTLILKFITFLSENFCLME